MPWAGTLSVSFKHKQRFVKIVTVSVVVVDFLIKSQELYFNVQ